MIQVNIFASGDNLDDLQKNQTIRTGTTSLIQDWQPEVSSSDIHINFVSSAVFASIKEPVCIVEIILANPNIIRGNTGLFDLAKHVLHLYKDYYFPKGELEVLVYQNDIYERCYDHT